jgi:prefoldin subunit 5
MNSYDIVNKVEEYSEFVTSTLRPELDRAQQSRTETRKEIAGYKNLGKQLRNFKETNIMEYESNVDLGYQTVSCNAVGDLTGIYLHVGMGFHIEMTIEEAIEFVKKRLEFLESEVLKRKELKVRETTEHLIVASSILDDLTRERERQR